MQRWLTVLLTFLSDMFMKMHPSQHSGLTFIHIFHRYIFLMYCIFYLETKRKKCTIEKKTFEIDRLSKQALRETRVLLCPCVAEPRGRR